MGELGESGRELFLDYLQSTLDSSFNKELGFSVSDFPLLIVTYRKENFA